MIIPEGYLIFLGDVATWSDPSIRQLPDYNIPLIQDLPGLGRILSGHNLLVYIAFAAVPATWWILYRTRFGLRLRGAAELRAEQPDDDGAEERRHRHEQVERFHVHSSAPVQSR